MSLRFFVPGAAVAQGSMRAWVHPRTKRVIMPQDAKVKSWRSVVQYFAAQAAGAVGWEITRDPIALTMEFLFARPPSHLRKDGIARPSAPLFPARPDLDKAIRSVGDALTGVVFADDAQVVSISAEKRYTSPAEPSPGVAILVEIT